MIKLLSEKSKLMPYHSKMSYDLDSGDQFKCYKYKTYNLELSSEKSFEYSGIGQEVPGVFSD